MDEWPGVAVNVDSRRRALPKMLPATSRIAGRPLARPAPHRPHRDRSLHVTGGRLLQRIHLSATVGRTRPVSREPDHRTCRPGRSARAIDGFELLMAASAARSRSCGSRSVPASTSCAQRPCLRRAGCRAAASPGVRPVHVPGACADGRRPGRHPTEALGDDGAPTARTRPRRHCMRSAVCPARRPRPRRPDRSRHARSRGWSTPR